MPMWYRGPDLRLAMVNSAYVARGRGRDAADVVARGLELVEGSGRGGPLAGAAAARDTGKPHEAGAAGDDRRRAAMLRIHDVPLPTGGVAGFAIDIEELEQARGGTKRFARGAAGDARPAVGGRRAVRRATAASSSATSRSGGCSRCAPNGSPTGPSSTACSSGCARRTGCPKCATSRAGRRSGATGSSRPTTAIEETLAPARRHAPARRRAAAARWRAAADLRGPHRAGPAGERARHAAAGAHRDVRQSVRGAGRVRGRRAAAAVEQPVPRAVGLRGGVPGVAPAGRCVGRQVGADKLATPDRVGADPRAGPVGDGRPAAARRARRVRGRAAFRIRGGAAARRQRAVHDARHHRQPPRRAGAARPRRGAGGGGPGQDAVRREHELRTAHAADLDRRLRGDAARRLCGQADASRRTAMSRRSWNRSSGWGC